MPSIIVMVPLLRNMDEAYLKCPPAALRGLPAVVGAHERQVVAAAPGALRQVPLRQGGGPPGACLDGQHPRIPVTWAHASGSTHALAACSLICKHVRRNPRLSKPFQSVHPCAEKISAHQSGQSLHTPAQYATSGDHSRSRLNQPGPYLYAMAQVTVSTGSRQPKRTPYSSIFPIRGRQRQGRQVSAQHSQLLCASLHAAQQGSGQSLQGSLARLIALTSSSTSPVRPCARADMASAMLMPQGVPASSAAPNARSGRLPGRPA